MSVFDRYAPFIQDFIYDHEWESLRGVQVAAGEAIFGSDAHVLLCAQTASGKTEAAFFPILTEFWEQPPATVGALYIGPTKALINDQFLRLNDLCEEADIPVWHWHGDVSASHKSKLLKRPSGILQITPESLEALLMHRHAMVGRLFGDLRYVVIDEVHSLLRQDRGGQTLCLIERLGRLAGVEPRRIGLSATIGDPEAVGRFLSAGTDRPTVIPQIEEPPRTWHLAMEHFYITGPQASDSPTAEADVVAVEKVESAGIAAPAATADGPSAAADVRSTAAGGPSLAAGGPSLATDARPVAADVHSVATGCVPHVILSEAKDLSRCSGLTVASRGKDSSPSAQNDVLAACSNGVLAAGSNGVLAACSNGVPAGGSNGVPAGGSKGVPAESSNGMLAAGSNGVPAAVQNDVLAAGHGDAGNAARTSAGVTANSAVEGAELAERPPQEMPSDVAPANADPGLGYIFEHTRGRKCLVFSNSREEAEAVCTGLRSYCEAVGEPDRFLIHHGNLSASIRETAEELMRDDASDLSIVATSTLELGIDVGRLERAFQIDAPFTVSSFLQRMGRTGRRGAPPEMFFVMREEQAEPRALLPETIPWKLLQGIALVQLTREEHWVEPPRLDRLPYSLLCHQTLATLASEGELAPADLARRVLTLTYFHRVSTDDFKVLLRHLLLHDYVEQTEAGGLIVGLAGERITSSFKFYAVFQENVEYTVRSDSQEIGTLVAPPPPGEKVAIAGHVWIVEEVDHQRHVLYVTQVKGKVPAYFGECPGDIHTHVLERMRRALEESEPYPYLMPHARARLRAARADARAGSLTKAPLIPLGETDKGAAMYALLPWLGSYAFLALERLLKIKCADELGIKGLDSSRPYFMTFVMREDPNAFYTVVANAAEALDDPNELLYPAEIPYFEKYDELVPTELVRKGFAEGVLDVAGMKARVAEWAQRG